MGFVEGSLTRPDGACYHNECWFGFAQCNLSLSCCFVRQQPYKIEAVLDCVWLPTASDTLFLRCRASGIRRAQSCIDLSWTFTLGEGHGRGIIHTNKSLARRRKVQRLRKALRSRSNSEAVRRVIDERLAVEVGLQALQNLRKLGGPEDVFRRAPKKRR